MSNNRLRSAVSATDYQRSWFRNVQAAAESGQPIALVNADAPHEIFRALDIPYVVTQWWSSIIAAKRAGPAALAQLAKQGLPDRSLQYDALPLGEKMLPAHERPWGGLPAPDFAVTERSGDVTQKIFEQWGNRPGTDTFLLSRTGAHRTPSRWWELVHENWEEVFGADRIDLLEEEIHELVTWLEVRTERRMNQDKLSEIMRLSNEQAEWNKKTHALIAAARPTPALVRDIMPAVMVPQWHRGTQWAVDAARGLYEEVRDRVHERTAICPDERRRLMWIGRGVWSDLALYEKFHQEFGAVFVWSMYLAIAADGYARYGDSSVRTLAARFVGLTDLLYVPPWSSEWYVKEAVSHGVDGVVHLVADDTPGPGFITEALEDRGIPVLEIHANNADQRSSKEARIPEQISEFINERL